MAQGSDQPLHERVLPRTSRCADNLLDPHAVNPLLKCFTVDRIAISKEIRWRAFPWEGFDDLLRRPLSSRILGDVEVQNLASRMGKHNQDEEKLESDRQYDEEIDRHKVMDVILQERLDTVLIHRRFRHVDAELSQFADNARRAHSGLAPETLRMSSRISSLISGRPGFPARPMRVQ